MDPTDELMAQTLGVPVNSGQNSAPGYTDEDALAAMLPGYASSATAPSAAPSPAPGPTTVPGQDQGTQPVVGGASGSPGPVAMPGEDLGTQPVGSPADVQAGVSGSVSTNGFSGKKYQQVQHGPDADLQREEAAIQADEAQKADEANQHFALAARAQKNAAIAETDAQVSYDREMGQMNAKAAALQRQFASEEAQAHAAASAQLSQARTNYAAALADFRASRVDPSQLWGKLSGGEKIGMMATAFVQDFLGAKGIKTSAMDTWNRAVDQNINAQLEAIKIKGQAAEGFKTLWDMQRAESASDEEARARMRGFYLESFKSSVEAHMAGFKSALTEAKGQAARALIDGEAAKNYFEVSKLQEQAVNARTGHAIQWAGDKLRASMEALKIASEERLKQKAEKPVDPYSGLLFDMSKSGGGKPVGAFKAGVPPDKQVEYSEKYAGMQEVTEKVGRLRSLLRQYKNRGITDVGRLTSTEQQEISSLRTGIAAGIARSRYGRVTANELEQTKQELPENLIGTKADLDSVLAGIEQRERDAWTKVQGQLTEPLSPDDPRNVLRANATVTDPQGSADASQTNKNLGKPLQSDPADLATKAMGRPDATEPASPGLVAQVRGEGDNEYHVRFPVDPQQVWDQFREPLINDYEKSRKLPPGGLPPTQVPAGAAAMAALAEEAKTGDAKALDTLEQFARTNSDDPARRHIQEFAQWELDIIGAGSTLPSQQPTELDDFNRLSKQAGLIP